MRIRCPFCGERDLGDFVYLGDARAQRPDAEAQDQDLGDTQARFVEAVYLRDNPAGRHEELWYHASGCRRWLCLTRDTRTHQILATAFASEEGGP